MKNAKKVILLLLCTALLVCSSIFATLAYLTDTEAVTNTFTVGSVGLSLDETDVKPDGTKDTDTRVQANEYHLLPGHTYIKDPVIHVDADSESCYIFVKVENPIAAYESKDADYNSIAKQIENNGWTALDGVENVFYKTYTKGQEDKDLEVFQEFTIDGMANTVDGWDSITPETTKVNVTGYAVQMDSFGSAKAAWDAADFPEDADAVVVTTTAEFTEAYKAGGSIKLGADIGFSQTFDPYTATSDVVLDLNGHTLSVSGVFYACRNMTIMDSHGGGELYAANIYAHNGAIRITGGTNYCDLASSSTGSYTITGGEVNGSLAMSSATITGGKFRSDPSRFVNPDTHTVTNSEGWYTVTAK